MQVIRNQRTSQLHLVLKKAYDSTCHSSNMHTHTLARKLPASMCTTKNRCAYQPSTSTLDHRPMQVDQPCTHYHNVVDLWDQVHRECHVEDLEVPSKPPDYPLNVNPDSWEWARLLYLFLCHLLSTFREVWGYDSDTMTQWHISYHDHRTSCLFLNLRYLKVTLSSL